MGSSPRSTQALMEALAMDLSRAVKVLHAYATSPRPASITRQDLMQTLYLLKLWSLSLRGLDYAPSDETSDRLRLLAEQL